MLQFMSLSSGSCGNCYYISNGKESVLIDAGVSLRRLKKIFDQESLSVDSVLGILVTHDHLDHIRNLGAFCKKLSKPVYATAELHAALAVHTFTKDYVPACRRDVVIGETISIGSFNVRCFEVPHDATQTVGYAIESNGYRLVIMTDIGRMTGEALRYASQADTVIVESNYDMDMLMGGPYTYDLKMRICKGNGHLCNDECADAIRKFWHPGLKNIFLCHLSENNNTPQRAFDTCSKALGEAGATVAETTLRCLPRRHPSPLLTLCQG